MGPGSQLCSCALRRDQANGSMFWQPARRLLKIQCGPWFKNPAAPMSKETASLRSRGWWDKQLSIRNRHQQLLLSYQKQCFEKKKKHAQILTVCVCMHRNNPRNLFIIAQAEPRWKPVFSRHHHDVGPRDCTVGGDNEPIGKQDGDSRALLASAFSG